MEQTLRLERVIMQFSFDTNSNEIAAKIEANERLTFGNVMNP